MPFLIICWYYTTLLLSLSSSILRIGLTNKLWLIYLSRTISYVGKHCVCSATVPICVTSGFSFCFLFLLFSITQYINIQNLTAISNHPHFILNIWEHVMGLHTLQKVYLKKNTLFEFNKNRSNCPKIALKFRLIWHNRAIREKCISLYVCPTGYSLSTHRPIYV